MPYVFFRRDSVYVVFVCFKLQLLGFGLYLLSIIGDGMDSTGDDNAKANGQPFTTKDRDNDKYDANCAATTKSAWWFKECCDSDFNRAYIGSSGRMFWGKFSSQIDVSILAIRRTS